MPIVAKSSDGLGMSLSGLGLLFLWHHVTLQTLSCGFVLRSLKDVVQLGMQLMSCLCFCLKYLSCMFMVVHSNAAVLIIINHVVSAVTFVQSDSLHLCLLVVANFSHPVCTVEARKHEQTKRPLAESPLCLLCVCERERESECVCLSAVCVYLCVYCMYTVVSSLSNQAIVERLIYKTEDFQCISFVKIPNTTQTLP